MKNINPIYLLRESNTYEHTYPTLAGAAIGGAGGNVISKALLKNVEDIKQFIVGTNDAKECITGLIGYADGATPIAMVVKKCINVCEKFPNNYKQKCLKILSNYNGLMSTIGTVGGAAAGGLGGWLIDNI